MVLKFYELNKLDLLLVEQLSLFCYCGENCTLLLYYCVIILF